MKISGKKKIALLLAALVVIALNVFIITKKDNRSVRAELLMTVSSDVSDNVQVFYSDRNGAIAEENSVVAGYQPDSAKMQKKVELSFTVDSNSEFLRIDLGTAQGEWRIYDVKSIYKDAVDTIDFESVLPKIEKNDIDTITYEEGALVIKTNEGDPYFIVPFEGTNLKNIASTANAKKVLALKIAFLVLIDGMAALAIIFRRKAFTLPVEIYRNKKLILKLAKNDFKTKFAGSYLGIVWAFVQPVVTILVYWFVFSVGFRNGKMDTVPFVLYLIAGIVPWFYCQELLNTGTNALIEYSYLVKKVVFKISVLPMVKAISAFFVHAFFVLVTFIIFTCYGIYPSVYSLQVFYYFICMFVLILGICYGTCAIVIFFRDLTQIINIILQVGVWTIPIMWDLNIVPERFRFIFKINPMYYVVNGYRDALYNHTWFWDHPETTLYFWVVTLILFVVGTTIFKKLKVHFADVL